MREQHIRNTLNTLLSSWSILLQYEKDKLDPILLDIIYQLYTSICQLLQLEGNYILDLWEEKNFNINDTIDYIINTHFEVVNKDKDKSKD